MAQIVVLTSCRSHYNVVTAKFQGGFNGTFSMLLWMTNKRAHNINFRMGSANFSPFSFFNQITARCQVTVL